MHRHSNTASHFRTREDVERIANNFSERLGLDSVLIVFLLPHILAQLHKIVRGFRLEIVHDEALSDEALEDGVEAWADCTNNTITIRKSFFESAMRGDPHARTTVLHEVAHLVLGHSHIRYFKNGVHLSKAALTNVERHEEWEAKRFSADVLMPKWRVADCKTVEEIQRRLPVSKESAEILLQEIQKDLRLRSGSPRPLPPKVINYLAAPERQRYRSRSRSMSPRPAERIAFVAMAFTTEMDRLYFESLKPTIERETSFKLLRGDEIARAGPVIDGIRHAIRSCKIVIAEITEFNPNVTHEIGLAESQGKPTLLICRRGYSDAEIPFNFRHIRRIEYTNDSGGWRSLCEQLVNILRRY